MGKYMRKSKAAGDVAVMEVAQSSSLGVRTRAKTLALQQSCSAAGGGGGGGSYLQLRSRKLEKPPLPDSKRGRQQQNPSPGCRTRARSRLGVSVEKLVEQDPQKENLKSASEIDSKENDEIEAFIGENSPDFEPRERSTRESTPCSFIRDPETVGPLGSATKAPSSTETSKRMQNSAQRLMPTAKEMEDLFAGAEEQQHRQFVEKYNFDPVKEEPLPGRFEWVKTVL